MLFAWEGVDVSTLILVRMRPYLRASGEDSVCEADGGEPFAQFWATSGVP